MACTYHLGQKVFDTELELEEYLLNNKEAIEQFGDEVFSKNYTTVQSQSKQVLLKSNERKNDLIKQGKLRRETTITEFSEEHYVAEKPYVAVTQYLKEYMTTDVNGKLHPLFPIFDIDNFFAEKAKDWKDEKYWRDKASPEEIRDVFGEEEPHSITTQDELAIVKKRIEQKWQHQGFLGTALHAAFNQFWMAPDYIKEDLNKLVSYLQDNLKGAVSKYTEKTYQDLIPNHVWEQIAKHCQGIYKELDQKFGGTDAKGNHIPPMILSEIGLEGKAQNPDGTTSQLIGIADLVVIDYQGNVQLIDYKTSPKSFGEYDSAKKRTFHYQLAVYRRLLQNLGLNIDRHSGAYIIPFKFENFRYDLDKDESNFDNLLGEAQNPETGETTFSYLEELPILTGDYAEGITSNLDSFLPINKIKDVRADEILQKLKDFMKQCFPTSTESQEITDEKVKERIERQNKFEKDPNTGKYNYKIGKKTIYSDDPVKLIAAVKKELVNIKNRTADLTQGLKRQIEHAQQTGIIDFSVGHYSTVGEYASESWLNDQLSRYATNDWTILDGPPVLESLGIILLLNKHTSQVNVVKVSNATWQRLDDAVLLGGKSAEDIKNNKNSTLTGTFENDIIQRQKPKSLIMESTYGNIELMQTMAVLNMLPNLFNNNQMAIGEIMVMDVRNQQGVTTSNKQLGYNFSELVRLNNKKNGLDIQNQFDDRTGVIKLLSLTETIKTQFKEILKNSTDPRWATKYSKWSNFKDATSNFDQFVKNPIKMRNELLHLIKKMEEHFNLNKVEFGSYSEIESPERRLYYYLHAAVAEIDGIDFLQQVRDHDKYLEHSNIIKEGWSGTMLDNPGQMSSDTLNHVTKQINIAYQNVRDDISKLNSELRKLINNLKIEKGFGWIKSRTIGNQTDLYKNMFDNTVTDELIFKNPWDSRNDLTQAEREFLMFTIRKINGDRDPKLKNDDLFNNKLIEDPEFILRVPLTIGSTSSQISTRSLLQVVKDRLQAILPKNIKDTVTKSIEGFLNPEHKEKIKNKTLWEMTNMFDASKDPSQRERTINYAFAQHPELGLDYFEHNLEALLLKHSFSYSLQQNMNQVFPTIKAAMLHLSMQGTIMNDKWAKDVDYLEKYIKNKIFNLSIDDPKWDTTREIVNYVMSGASKMALAFNPRQLYQALDGLWKDISLVIRKPDGDTSFTKDNMIDAFF